MARKTKAPKAGSGGKRPEGTVARLQERLAIEHGTTHALANSSSLGEAAPRVIRAVCETLGWDCGACWTINPADESLHCVGQWGVGQPAVQAFLAHTPPVTQLDAPRGLIRRAWADGGPVWIRDVSADDTFRRGPQARAAGLRAALAFPIMADDKVIAVMEFFSQAVRPPDPELLDCTRYMSILIGQFVRRAEAQEQVAQSEERYRSTFELAASGIAQIDPASGRFLKVNRTLCAMLGYTEAELLALTVKALSHPEDRDVTDLRRQSVLSGEQEAVRFEKRYVHKQGRTVWVSLAIAAVRGADGTPLYEVAIFDDITGRKQAESLQRLEHTVTRQLAEATTVDGAISAVMRAVCGSQGWSCAEYWALDEQAQLLRFGGFWTSLGPEINDMFGRSRDYAFAQGEGLVGRAWQSGEPLWVADVLADGRIKRKELAREAGLRGAFIIPVSTAGEMIGALSFWSREIRSPDQRLLEAVRAIGSQVAQFVRRKQAEERIQYFATHDGLTGLPNREMFNQLLATAIESGRRYQREFALLFIDLDGFKEVNDTHGHEAGDRVLRQVAVRLRRNLRASDVVARLGGDEFVVLIHAAEGEEPANAVVNKLLTALPQPVPIEGGQCAVSASIGVAAYPRHAEDATALLKAADAAMYAAKQAGKNTYAVAG